MGVIIDFLSFVLLTVFLLVAVATLLVAFGMTIVSVAMPIFKEIIDSIRKSEDSK